MVVLQHHFPTCSQGFPVPSFLLHTSHSHWLFGLLLKINPNLILSFVYLQIHGCSAALNNPGTGPSWRSTWSYILLLEYRLEPLSLQQLQVAYPFMSSNNVPPRNILFEYIFIMSFCLRSNDDIIQNLLLSLCGKRDKGRVIDHTKAIAAVC